MDNVNDYIELVRAPWGRMFYDLLFMQLNLPSVSKLKILDFGSGLSITSNKYAKWHDVTALEPNEEMIKNSRKENAYKQIIGGIEKTKMFNDNTFDIVLCHNVLEYIEDKEPILSELLRILKKDGTLSIIKHNRAGRIFHNAVFGNDPKKAISLLDLHSNDKSNYLGIQYIYTNDDLNVWVSRYGGHIYQVLGMRTFWALGQDNSIKYTDEWYSNMLILENSVADKEEYIQTAFFNHLFIRKILD